jgi:5-formyltetrahydrofolate cyclo-ligase
LPLEDFSAQGKAAAALLRDSPLWPRYETVLLFLSMPREIDTTPLLELALGAGKRVFAPRLAGRGELLFLRALSAAGPWEEGPFGIREPPAAGEPFGPADFPALILVPGLAFDRLGRRLGRGGAYYDRFLGALAAGSGLPGLPAERRPYRTVGLCMPLQLMPEVPAESWDIPVDALCTGLTLTWSLSPNNIGLF